MLCFSFYLAALWPKGVAKRTLAMLFGLQWILNVLWNPLFFYFHFTMISLAEILFLTALIGWIIYFYRQHFPLGFLLLLPYFLWLCIASSLNGYICFMNS